MIYRKMKRAQKIEQEAEQEAEQKQEKRKEKKKKIFMSLLVTALIVWIPHNVIATEGNNFFQQRYRGWLWFEETPKEEVTKLEEEQPANPTIEDMQRARAENEAFKEKLDLYRHLTVRYPDNIEYAKMFRVLENQMLEQAATLANSFMLANFLYPDLSGQMEAPANIYGRRIQKDLQEAENKEKISKIAKQVELFVFRKRGCMYCSTLEKHLYKFAHRYGFSVEAVSLDASDSEYFKTHHDQDIIAALSLEVMPTVIAVVVETKERFELARGAVAISNLEDASVMLYDYLQEYREKGSVL